MTTEVNEAIFKAATQSNLAERNKIYKDDHEFIKDEIIKRYGNIIKDDIEACVKDLTTKFTNLNNDKNEIIKLILPMLVVLSAGFLVDSKFFNSNAEAVDYLVRNTDKFGEVIKNYYNGK